MANSLTQWPMQPIPFPSGVRTNPIGWGFGASTHTTPTAPSTPHRPPLQHSFTTPQPSLSFGQAPPASNDLEARHQWCAQTPTERKKRSRGSDSSSSSSVNRAAKIASRPIAGSSKRRLGDRESVKEEDGNVDLGILLSKLNCSGA